MRPRALLLHQLVADGLYPVDEHAVAGAILARATLRAYLPDSQLRSAQRDPAVRSFRRDPEARSFRLARGHTPRYARR